MKEKNYNLYTKVLAGLICYAAAFCLLSDWYDTEWLELDLEFKKSDLVCIMASEDPKVYAEQSKRVDREIAARQNMILESQVWLAKISRYLWIIAFLPVFLIFAVHKLFHVFLASSSTKVGVIIVFVFVVSGLILGLAKYFF